MTGSCGQFIYVHYPFCRRKCHYCDFFSIVAGAQTTEIARTWFGTILREMRLLAQAGDLDPQAPIVSIYIGGGTPSLAKAEDLRAFMDAVRREYTIAPDAEITIEMRPGTADEQELASYAAAGISRFSVGVQTLNSRVLDQSGRLHTADDSRAMLRAAARAGARLSVDLICAWPGQTLEAWRHDLHEVLSFRPEHISAYELTFHHSTMFGRRLEEGTLSEAGEDLRVAMFEETERTLCGAGYEHYEISNYALPACRSRHNENYWRLGNYIGLGAGAHSFVFPHRYVNANDIQGYAAAIGAGQLFRRVSDSVHPDIFILENLQMALRLSEGVDLDWFASKFGRDVRQTHGSKLCQLHDAGFVEWSPPSSLRLTKAGRQRMDSVIDYLL